MYILKYLMKPRPILALLMLLLDQELLLQVALAQLTGQMAHISWSYPWIKMVDPTIF